MRKRTINLPEHLHAQWPTTHAFRAAKRGSLNWIQSMFERFMHASAYMPPDAYRLALKIRLDIQDLRRMLSVREWGR